MADKMIGRVLWTVSLLQMLCMEGRIQARALVSQSSPCSAADGVIVYTVTTETFWSSELFPKQYPMFRPHAQWSRVVGRSHGDGYKLWQEGLPATAAVKQFAETGDSSTLDLESQGHNGVFDVFSAPNIDQGVGRTSTDMFVDTDHAQVSLLVHLIPSPDWFVGLDSESLCSGGDWIERKTLDLRLWDAGTDKGYTFTAPNWPEVPQKPIDEITSSFPNHVASSFYYRELSKLPTLARVTFERKVLLKGQQIGQPQRDWTPLKGELSIGDSPKRISDNNHLPVGKNGVASTPGPARSLLGELSDAALVRPTTSTQKHERNTPVGRKETKVVKNDENEMTPATQTTTPPTLTETVEEDTLTKKEKKRRRREKKKNRKNKERKRKKNRNENRKNKKAEKKSRELLQTKQDAGCGSSEWGEWSACTKTCGYGSRRRMRTVIQPASGSGSSKCVTLEEDEMCGSMRGCGWNHFSSQNWGSLVK